MEENARELFDYLNVIWKRKILIIVMTLVGTGVGIGGVVVEKLKTELPPNVIYRAVAVVKIGKKVSMVEGGRFTSSSVVEYIEEPQRLVYTFPLQYNFKIKQIPEYGLEIEQVGTLSMIKLIMSGPDKGVERILEELVNMLIEEHHIKAENAVGAYRNFMEKLEVQAKKLEEEIKVLVVSIEDMKRKEGEHLLHIDSVTKESTEDKRIGDRSAFLNLLYLKTIEKESNLSSSRTNLRNIQRQLTLYQITLGNLEEYKTEMVGEIKNTVIESNVAKKMKPNILVVAIASLIISLFIVFLMEYIEESKLRRKGKLQG